MPATYAHYVFGRTVFKRLPDPVRQIIRENKEAYLIGLHGPDILFYYHPYGRNRVNQTGSRMHRELASDFFEKGRGVYQSRPSYVLLSYLFGFICHFTLDSECHPYIGHYMEEFGVSHSDVETDLDLALLKKDKKDPVRQDYTRHLIRDLDTEEAIASVLDGVTVDQVDTSLVGFRWCIRMLQCPCSGKEHLERFLFRLVGQSSYFGGMIMTGREHPRCAESREFLQERLEKSVDVAVGLIQEYAEKLQTLEPLSERFRRDFE